MSPTVVVELVHVVSAIVFAAGYIGTNILTELARSSDDTVIRRTALALGGWFDQFLQIPFGVLAGLSGLLLTVMIGYPLTSEWVWLSTLLYAAIIGLRLTVWRNRGIRIDAALAADGDDEVAALLRETPYVVLSRAENVAVFLIVVLMVVRPA